MSEPAVKVIAMPADANAEGDIFGGWIISMMDLAGYVCARKQSKHKLVTVAMENVVFHEPVFIGDALECYASIEKIGRTSMTVKIEAMVERFRPKPGQENMKEKVTEGHFVYVAIDKDRKPVPVQG